MTKPPPPPPETQTTQLDHVTEWVFDLDNTLYPPAARLFDQIDARMTGWMAQVLNLPRSEASALRLTYWQRYGTTLAGLMEEHGVEPHAFLEHVHDITLDTLTPDPVLAERIAALPGRKFVFTNGSHSHACRVLRARGLEGSFDGAFGIEQADFVPKPQAGAFARIFARAGICPHTAAMFEDDPRNLIEPARIGMQTVYVAETPISAPHIHHHTDNLSRFLGQVTSGTVRRTSL